MNTPEKKPVEVVLVDDHRMFRSGVRAELGSTVTIVGEAPVSLYHEVGPSGVEAFVRDHGPGFDLDEVPDDRLGVRQSILGRMDRHGGTARVRRLEHGTEVVLTLPAVPVTPPAPAAPAAAAAPGTAAAPAGPTSTGPARPDPQHPVPEETREHA